MSKALSLQDARNKMANVKGWALDESEMRLAQTFEFASFAALMRFVKALAELAEAKNHHPDFSVHFKRLDLVLWSHDANGLTGRDFALAQEINDLVASRQSW